MFVDRLKATLALTLGSDAVSIAAGALRSIVLDVTTVSFDADVTFEVSSELAADPVFASFTTRSLLKAQLSLASLDLDADSDDARPLVVTGFVTEKRMTEITSESLDALPIVTRRYSIKFADPAQVFWREHHPLELHVETAMVELLALHSFSGMSLAYRWPRMAEKQDVLCVPLAADGPASFYDFVMWFVDRNNGVLELDAGAGEYTFRPSKSRGSHEVTFDGEEIGEVRILPPEPLRHTPHVLNPFAPAAANVPIPNVDASVGVRRDVFAYEPIETRFAMRVLVEKSRIKAPEHALEVSYKRIPIAMPVAGDSATLGGELSAKLHSNEKTYRVANVHLEARATVSPDGDEPDVRDLDDASATFDLDLRANLELRTNPVPHLPPFHPPVYPLFVEGRVLSASGEDEDRTWFVIENANDSLYQCRCDIPLWNKKVVTPFTPNRLPGHFFFPAYKNQRVLVALDFDSAKVDSFLDWASNAKLSKDTQGNKIALGNKEENGTTIAHTYVDEKPVLTMVRRLGGDQETITLSEGTIRIEVKEDPTAIKVEPKYDVVIQVAGAKERVASAVKGSIGEVSGKFEASMGQVTGSLESASAEVEAGVVDAETKLIAKIEAVEASLSALGASGAAAVSALAAKVPEAKGAIMAALFE